MPSFRRCIQIGFLETDANVYRLMVAFGVWGLGFGGWNYEGGERTRTSAGLRRRWVVLRRRWRWVVLTRRWGPDEEVGGPGAKAGGPDEEVRSEILGCLRSCRWFRIDTSSARCAWCRSTSAFPFVFEVKRGFSKCYVFDRLEQRCAMLATFG